MVLFCCDDSPDNDRNEQRRHGEDGDPVRPRGYGDQFFSSGLAVQYGQDFIIKLRDYKTTRIFVLKYS